MKRVCYYCGRSFSTGDMWCQESYCTIENMPPVLDHGEELADITIKKAIVVTRTAVVYEATRYDEDILIKIAHEGMEEKLINEAVLLRDIQSGKMKHPALPTLLPAYYQEDVKNYPYAETVFRGERKHFFCARASRRGSAERHVDEKFPALDRQCRFYRHSLS